MKFTSAAFFFLISAAVTSAQTTGTAKTINSGAPLSPPAASISADAVPPPAYVVIGANPHEEALIRSEMERIQPAVLPLRVIFVPHWKYVDNTRIFQLHVPKGFSSAMFTHLPSRTTFIDADRYLGDEYLRHYFAHELGHLASNSAKEEDAERIAKQYRKRSRGVPTSF